MTDMLSLKSKLSPKVCDETFRRFPISIICSFLFFVTSVSDFNVKIDMLFILFYAFLWFFNFKLLWESLNKKIQSYYLISIPLFVAVILYIFAFLYFPPALIFFIIILIISATIAPSKTIERNKDFFNFNYVIWSNFLFTFFVSAILFLGLSLIFLTIFYLFSISGTPKFLFNLWLFCATIFAPFFWLSRVPKEVTPTETLEISKSFKFILQNVIIPVVLFYFAIIYIYFLNIVIKWEFPKGKLAYIVMSFGIIGILLHLLTYNTKSFERSYVKIFHKYFYKIFLLPLLLLFYSIYLRVTEYGITPMRYFVIAIAIWFTFISVIQIFYQKKFRLYLIPLSLVIILLIGTFGSLNAKNISYYSQSSRLKKIFEKHNLIRNGKILKDSSEVLSFQDKKDATSIIKYFVNNRQEEDILLLLEEKPTLPKNKNYKKQSILAQAMGFNIYSRGREEVKQYRPEFPNRVYGKPRVSDVKEYDLFVSFPSSFYVNYKTKKIEDRIFDVKYSVSKSIKIEFKNNIISVSNDKNQKIDFYLLELMQPHYDEKKLSFNEGELFFVQNNESFNVKVYIKSIAIIVDKETLKDIKSISFDLALSGI